MSKLNKLKEKFDKVIIKYTEESCSVMLVDGLNIYTGFSRCHVSDNFNKKLGRTIALGRAEFASKLVSGSKSERKSDEFASGEVKYKVFACDNTKQVEECINHFLPKKKEA